MIKYATSQKVSYDPFRCGRVEKAILATQSQREMWSTLVLSAEANICYNEVISMEISGKVSEIKLDYAFQEVLKRHEALRSSFSDDGKYFIVHEYKYQKLSVIHCSEDEFQKLKRKEVEIPFDLNNGPLARASLIRISNDRSYLLFSAHHIVCDGWSLAILLTELTRAYEGKKLLAPSSFVDFALKESFEGINQKDRSYWLSLFQTPFSGNNLPLDFIRPQYRTYESDRIDLDVSPSLVSSLKKFSAKNRISFYTLLMGSFNILLSKITNKNDIIVGMATAAQSIPGNEEVVGHLVNMLPIRSNVNGNLKTCQYLQGLKSLMMDAIDHQCYTFGSLLQDLSIERKPNEIPLVNVVFNIDQQLPNQGLEFSTVSAHYKSVPRIKENFEIFINAVNRGDELTLECQYNKNLFKEDTIKNWLKSYVELLTVIIQGDQLISALSLSDLRVPQLETNVEILKKNILQVDKVIEEKLINIWARILNKEVGPVDNFFSLGGHSLLVVEMITLIEEEFSKKLTARIIFENPTVRELSHILLSLDDSRDEKIKRIQEKKFYDVSQNQLQVWYLEEVFHSTNMHNLPSCIHLKFEVDHLALEKALNSLISRHEAFRTKILVEEGLPVSVIAQEHSYYQLAVEKVSEHELENVLYQLAMKPISKERPPLFHAKLFKLTDNNFAFFFMPHHAIWDGWSFDIFFEELNIAYSSFINKKPLPEFKPLTLTYKDYAYWLNNQIKEGKLEHERDFWKDQLKAPLPALNLTSTKRPTEISFKGKTFAFELDQSLIFNLNSFAQNHGVSLYNVILTAFKVSLAKFADTEDIIVGTPVRCRNFPELLNIIGYFVNTVALRTKIKTQDSFISNLKKVTQTSIKAFDHDQLPFQEVLKSITIPRDSSRTPIYQTFFSYQDVTGRSPVLDRHAYQQINVNKNSTHTDLDLWVKASKTKIEGAFEYREALFSNEWIEDFFNVFITNLKNVTSNVATKDNLLSRNSSTAGISSIVLMFEKSAEIYPDKLAIKSDSSRLSYQELNEKSNQFANALTESGVKSGDLVGIAISRKIEMLIALLGVLKVGAGYVPLDPSFPQDRLDYMLDNSNIKVLITENQLQARFSPHLTKLTLESLLESSFDKNNLKRDIPLSNTAYVIYTSGSTGKPKGVDISHLGLANFLISMSKNPGISPNDRLLAVTTLSFDIAGLELFLPLISGASIYLANSYDVIDGHALKTIIEKHSITYMQATPSTWRLLLAAGWKGDASFKILCGGEAFPRDLAVKLIPLVESVWNMYGPTETTIWSTCKKLEADEQITVGTPIDNTTVYILDENHNILRPGEEGELFIGGMGLAKGYFNRQDLTDERFISHPKNQSEKIYATGDLAKINEFGELEVLGRLDGQVKVRGYRIELGEIEAQLNSLEEIELSAAITKEVKKGDARIIAYFVLKRGMTINDSQLRDKLAVVLPKYMIPSHFISIGSIPQTLNGKIDKKALGEMFVIPDSQQNSLEDIAPPVALVTNSKGVEEIREIWKQVLSVSHISDEDNFFDIGGNSLLAVDLSNRMSKKLGKNFQLSVLLHNPDFLSFSRHFTQASSSSDLLLNSKYLVPIKKTGTKNPLFCVHTVGGNVLNYIQLIPAMGDDRPLYGIQSAGIVDNDHPGSIEEMATLYIQEMKLLQPQGPYLIAGGSMGGMIALEIAQQLLTVGDKVERLIMFDTFGPDFDIKAYKDDQRSRLSNFVVMLDYYYQTFKLRLKRRLFNFLGAPETLEMKLFDLEVKNYNALWNYRPRSFEGDLYLIRNQLKDHGWYSDKYLGWRKLIKGNVHLSFIDASHSAFIESEDLIEALNKVL